MYTVYVYHVCGSFHTISQFLFQVWVKRELESDEEKGDNYIDVEEGNTLVSDDVKIEIDYAEEDLIGKFFILMNYTENWIQVMPGYKAGRGNSSVGRVLDL